MQLLGDLIGNLRFMKRGGKCAAPGCSKDAPFVLDGKRRLALPCSEHERVDREEAEAAERARLALRYLPAAGGTERLSPWSFDTYREQCADPDGLRALAVAERWVEDYMNSIPDPEEHDDHLRLGRAPCVFLHGPVGCGKTGLAWSMVRALCEQGVEARLVNWLTLLNAIKDGFAKKETGAAALRLRALPVIVLDDLGSEPPTKWAREQLLRVVDYRYEQRLATVYVSNFRPSALAKQLGHDDPLIGERIVSRMTDGSIVFEMESRDRRSRLAA